MLSFHPLKHSGELSWDSIISRFNTEVPTLSFVKLCCVRPTVLVRKLHLRFCITQQWAIWPVNLHPGDASSIELLQVSVVLLSLHKTRLLSVHEARERTI